MARADGQVRKRLQLSQVEGCVQIHAFGLDLVADLLHNSRTICRFNTERDRNGRASASGLAGAGDIDLPRPCPEAES